MPLRYRHRYLLCIATRVFPPSLIVDNVSVHKLEVSIQTCTKSSTLPRCGTNLVSGPLALEHARIMHAASAARYYPQHHLPWPHGEDKLPFHVVNGAQQGVLVSRVLSCPACGSPNTLGALEGCSHSALYVTAEEPMGLRLVSACQPLRFSRRASLERIRTAPSPRQHPTVNAVVF